MDISANAHLQQMREVLYHLYYITSIAGGQTPDRAGYEAFWEEWLQMYENEFVLMAQYYSMQDFALQVHEYLRVRMGIGYKTYAWNLFITVTNYEPCNCICSSYFVLLACLAVGFFGPGKMLGALVPAHIVVVLDNERQQTPDTPTFLRQSNQFLETTELCKTNWLPVSLLHQAFGVLQAYHIVTVQDLLATFATDAAHRMPDREQAYELLLQYPAPYNPSYLVALLDTAPEYVDGEPNQQLLLDLDKLLDTIAGPLVFNYVDPLYALVGKIVELAPDFIDTAPVLYETVTNRAFRVLLPFFTPP